jgi:dihydroxy-acid dehydratase
VTGGKRSDPRTRTTELRSRAWFGDEGRNGFIHRSWLKGDGVPDEAFDGRPVVGIANTWSQLTPCNSNLRRVAEFVARGVWEAGGFPLEFPVMSLGETLMRPSSMLFRNLMAMELEEQLRANPLDAVVLLGGCDKTIPGLLMGAASVDLPTMVVSSGPKLSGKYQGGDISGADIWKFADKVRTGTISHEEHVAVERCLSRSEGHCMTMASASTMAVITETIGLQLSGGAAVPAVDSNRYTLAHLTGRQAVEIAKQDLRMSKLVTRRAFENAVKVNAAIGGSTNAVVHLLAFAGRLGLDVSLDDMDRWTQNVPQLLNLKPSGEHLMEDFYYAGGTPALLRELLPLLNADELMATGKTLAEEVADAPCWDHQVIATVGKPFKDPGCGIAVLKGNICPGGAIIKQSAASARLLKHRGKALVFDSLDDLDKAADDPSLEVDENSVLVLRNAGPRGYPGMPEVGNLPIPTKLLKAGVTDMVRISDTRMSGAGSGTVILHVAPEAAVGGPLALIKTGDWIELDVPGRSLRVDLSDSEMEERRAASKVVPPTADRGYLRLHHEHVMQADRGADLDFLVGGSGHEVGRRPF